jgi:hypothetical protein
MSVVTLVQLSDFTPTAGPGVDTEVSRPLEPGRS